MTNKSVVLRHHHLSSLLLIVLTVNFIVTARAVAGLAVVSGPPPPPPLSKVSEHLPLARHAMNYLDQSTDPFHAVDTSIRLLEEAGFVSVEHMNFAQTLQRGGKYYYTKNKSTLVAFRVGENFQTGHGFVIIGCHTDSPNLRVKPRSKRGNGGAGCVQLGVECYGGGLWHTWFDRDLGLSGRVLVRNSDDNATKKIAQKLIRIDRALLRISNLAIHLQTQDERKAFTVNKEDHLSPILALEAKKALTTGTGDRADEAKEEQSGTKDGWTEYQEPALLQVLANELGLENAQDIVDFELSLFDVQKAALGGAFSEFVHSARLDNLASCFMAVSALIEHSAAAPSKSLEQNERTKNTEEWDADVNMVVLYDHEEVGSTSAVGAASPILMEAIRRISTAFLPSSANIWSKADLHEACIQRSFVLSSDQAHAVHPNYRTKHEKNHEPMMNQGMVIKRNSNQRYATTTVSGVLIREIARKAGLLAPQEFIVRQDCGCGSTIGPIISSATGIRTIDIGCPQLSMHSIRETMGICDLTNGLNLFKAYFAHFREVDSSLEQ